MSIFVFNGRYGSSAAIAVLLLVTTFFAVNSSALAQQTRNGQSLLDQTDDRITGQIQDHLNAGEYPKAIEKSQTLSAPNRDLWLGKVADAQLSNGDVDAAIGTVAEFDSDLNRAKVLAQVFDYPPNQSAGSSNNGGVGGGGGGMGGAFGGPGQRVAGAGGITANDFQPLMDLISNTIDSDSWQATGTGEGTMQPFPSGVYVDGSGVLQKLETKRKKPLLGRKGPGQEIKLTNDEVMKDASLRKISLTELEKQAQLLVARGLPLTPEMKNLGGITEIKYLMIYPETGDVVIAGPAGPFERDERGRAVNIETGHPVLQLDDLVVCLRNAWNAKGKFGCAIVPREESLAKTKRFLATSNLKGKPWRDALRATLGQQDIDVFGIEPGSHAATVLVEADYRMKLVGMGLEPTIPQVPSYLERVSLDANGNPPPMDVVRWWFTLSYENVLANESRNLFTFAGPGVKVLSETEFINNEGQRIHTGMSVGPTKAFAKDFTEHFEEMATVYPIYRELKNVFDLAIVANLIRDQQLTKRTDWNLTFFSGLPRKGFVTTVGAPTQFRKLRYQLAVGASPQAVDTVMNHRVITERRGRVTRKHTLVGVSGGVKFDAFAAMGKERIVTEKDVEFLQVRTRSTPQELGLSRADRRWWWD